MSRIGHDHTTDNFFPWSYPPVCTRHFASLNSPLCIYTNTTFSNNRGISIFTTPAIASAFSQLAPFQDPSALSGINVPSGPSTPWRTAEIPGKGTGMLAAKPLSRGDRITAYTPALLAHMEAELSTAEREKYLRIAIEQLPTETREGFLGLATIYKNPRLIVQDVVKANAFEMQVGGTMHLALFVEPSRFNHDCGANAQYFLEPGLLGHFVNAARAIRKGEEITISYTNPRASHQDRQKALSAFHFTCTCARCLSSRSDAIHEEINAIQATLSDWNTWPSGASRKKAERLIKLYKQEGLDGFLDTAYGYAALTYSAFGDEKHAKLYAGLAAEAAPLRHGSLPPDMGIWSSLMEDPRGHWSWGWWVRRRGGN